MRKNINRQAVTILTTDPTVFPILKAKLTQESESYQIHAHFFSDRERICEVLKDLRQLEVLEDNNQQFVWVLREEEKELVRDILSFHLASVITTNKMSLETDFMNSLNYYPYVALPLQTMILKQVNHINKRDDSMPLDLTSYHQLNPTEKAIVSQLYKGKTTNQIAENVCISYHTVNNNIALIKKKFNVKTKVDIIKHIIKTNQQTQLRQKEAKIYAKTI
ncbi:helix-turn-helix transcriptional regulator [Alkalihalophilus pseudofirmus]|uniref:Helix-turn-helix transcriptional regulator n=1 Tax=Alkalihalophilus pseudofirmus TaxID=79885 RepID=A0AAJ2NPN4_ALKPS|nr:helix-turn-helix transcriptional regulator [Alkalihalophilus pseudofirmus]MDV2886280.1 helix-turn-helix transcriptional regulator [Alkalihalophilus pseudofirmus]